MKYAEIRHTDLKACRIVMGSAEFGTTLTEDQSFELLDLYFKAGGNIIDTASVYADWLKVGKSLSEKTIGKWLSSRNIRDKIIISTKGGHHDLFTLQKRVDVPSIKEDFESSLENLKTDYIDIYWFHKDDEDKSPEELIEVLNEAVDKSKVGYFGASNWPYDRIKKANEHAKKKGLTPIIASQMRHSIAKLNFEKSDIFSMTPSEYEKYANDDLNVFGFSTQARGFYAIMEKGGEAALPEPTKKELYNDYNVKVFERLCALAKKKGTTVPALVLAALICDERVNTFAQIGSRTPEELALSMSALDIEISAEERAELLK